MPALNASLPMVNDTDISRFLDAGPGVKLAAQDKNNSRKPTTMVRVYNANYVAGAIRLISTQIEQLCSTSNTVGNSESASDVAHTYPTNKTLG